MSRPSPSSAWGVHTHVIAALRALFGGRGRQVRVVEVPLVAPVVAVAGAEDDEVGVRVRDTVGGNQLARAERRAVDDPRVERERLHVVRAERRAVVEQVRGRVHVRPRVRRTREFGDPVAVAFERRVRRHGRRRVARIRQSRVEVVREVPHGRGYHRRGVNVRGGSRDSDKD